MWASGRHAAMLWHCGRAHTPCSVPRTTCPGCALAACCAALLECSVGAGGGGRQGQGFHVVTGPSCCDRPLLCDRPVLDAHPSHLPCYRTLASPLPPASRSCRPRAWLWCPLRTTSKKGMTDWGPLEASLHKDKAAPPPPPRPSPLPTHTSLPLNTGALRALSTPPFMHLRTNTLGYLKHWPQHPAKVDRVVLLA